MIANRKMTEPCRVLAHQYRANRIVRSLVSRMLDLLDDTQGSACLDAVATHVIVLDPAAEPIGRRIRPGVVVMGVKDLRDFSIGCVDGDVASLTLVSTTKRCATHAFGVPKKGAVLTGLVAHLAESCAVYTYGFDVSPHAHALDASWGGVGCSADRTQLDALFETDSGVM